MKIGEFTIQDEKRTKITKIFVPIQVSEMRCFKLRSQGNARSLIMVPKRPRGPKRTH